MAMAMAMAMAVTILEADAPRWLRMKFLQGKPIKGRRAMVG